MRTPTLLPALCLTALVALAGCSDDDGGGPLPTAVPTATATSPPPPSATATAEPASTATPTLTTAPAETATATPTATVVAEETATPTATAVPEDTATPTVTETPGAATANVRVVHGCPDAPPVDVLVDGVVALSEVPYLAFSDYLAVPAGTRNVQVRASEGGAVVIDADLELAGGTDYTVIATNVLAAIEALVLVDDRSLPGDEAVSVRVVHGAVNAGLVDVYVTGPDDELEAPLLEDFDFKDVTGYLTIPSGTYRVRVTPAGTTDVVIDTGALDLPANTVLTVIAVEAEGGGAPFGVLPLVDATASE